MEKINQSVVKKDHASKISGQAVYVGDYPNENVLVGKLLRSKFARARILSVEVPPLPDGYFYVDRTDVPGDNNVSIVLDDTPVYARETVEYIGEPIGMVMGPDEKEVQRILSEIKVSYEELNPVLDIRKAEPDFAIPFDLEKFQGDAYPTYAWAVNAIEVQVDTCTGLSKILGAYGSFDVGTPIDYNIVMGQMEGGFLQGIGYASIEKMDYDGKGRIRNNSFSDYLIPTAKDVPNLQCMLHVEKYPDGPYGAKGAGELPLVGALGAYVEAMEQALGNIMLSRVPFTAEDTLAVIRKEAE